jgi:uncharacterized protein
MPVLYGASFQLGCILLGTDSATQTALNRHTSITSDMASLWEPVVKPMLAGSIPLGIVLAAISFEVVRNAMTSLRERRNQGLRGAPAGRTIPT